MTHATGRPRSDVVLVAALLALAALYVAWFAPMPDPWIALSVFAAPPALLALARWRGHRSAAFWAGVLALAWFSHGVMVAWTRAPERAYALLEIGLALVVVVASSWPGVRARFGRK